MLSYQHQFHAGNHADVFKHLCLIALINKFKQKSRPFFFADSHAGEGEYLLNTNEDNRFDEAFARHLDFSLKNTQSNTQNEFTMLNNSVFNDYEHLLNDYSTQQGNNPVYPGSSVILKDLCCAGNSIHVNELHNDAYKKLKRRMRGSGIHVHQRDAYEFINALLPPKAPQPMRGGILIDPPYEDSYEYDNVYEVVNNTIKKWPIGIFAIWYPLLSEHRKDKRSGQLLRNPKSGLSEKMVERIAGLQMNGLIDCRFIWQDKRDFNGMYGSGIALINPPWQIEEVLTEVLSFLNAQLPESNQGYSELNTLLRSA
ncbi:23S rRNA (adenine(2030)-N(6))-methyltransferase RlmJ [Glaciecola petra]|uniref:Ribosomal RNA large subunit methyltransferase J n=1 Tax=Glaciecola petra TaxID=3075602 RepID=A0ABU2ZNY9_9ALTE|nr:23S rRNA (adenine(2030)-N(6))-methyltransferase RlmJ [Aestuariibacter sp. P117]MDT0594342.1 23S rRNA (adenine(2030)-N(6))-methyltransferase RlmJ [Aestuariibacter sp. P117]